MQRAGVFAGGGDREIADVVGFDTRASPEGGFDRPLGIAGAHRADCIFERPLRYRAGAAEFGELVLVFDQAHL